jgi:hypothetical protein
MWIVLLYPLLDWTLITPIPLGILLAERLCNLSRPRAGIKGVLVDVYGVYAESLNDAVIRKLKIQR